MMDDKKHADPAKASLSVELYEELSGLNNQLADMHRELGKKNTELKKLNEEKNRFLGMAAHDIRKPLSVISLYSEFLLKELAGRITSEQEEFLHIIMDTGKSALGLVNDYLDFSKIEAGRLDIDLQQGDVADLVRDVVRLNAVFADKKGMRIQTEIRGEAAQMVFDANKLRQVLDNIICNAVKFAPESTTVTVTLQREGDDVVISVRDQGPGIPEDEQNLLFQPYGRTSVRSSGSYKDTGLGLVISKKIVEAHRGRLWVESRVGTGSTFFVSLPAQSLKK